MAAIKLIDCIGGQVTNSQFTNCGVGVEVEGGWDNTVDGVLAINTPEAVRIVSSRNPVVKNVLVRMPLDVPVIPRGLQKALKTVIENDNDLPVVQSLFGDRLRGYGWDLDEWLQRFGNGAAVLAFILDALQYMKNAGMG